MHMVAVVTGCRNGLVGFILALVAQMWIESATLTFISSSESYRN